MNDEVSMPGGAEPLPEKIEFECAHCKIRLKVAASLAGQDAKCPNCNQVSPVPPPISDGLPEPIIEAALPTSPFDKEDDQSQSSDRVGAETETRKLYRRISEEIAKIFVGQDELVQGALVALFLAVTY